MQVLHALAFCDQKANIAIMTPITPAQKPTAPSRLVRRHFATGRAIMALILREMSSTYGRSPGGYLWAILEPVAGIALLSLVFAAAFDSPPLGISFPTFYATGMLPFILFSDIQGKIATSLMFSKQLLAYPTVTFLDAILARFLLNLVTQILVGYFILLTCIALFETRVTLDLPVIVQAYALAAFLGLGIGTLNAYLFTRFNLMQQAWSILMRPMFIISGIFLLFEAMPMPYRDYLWYNPLVHIIGLTRSGFYGTYDANYVSTLFVFGVSIVCLSLGLMLLRRHYRDLLLR